MTHSFPTRRSSDRKIRNEIGIYCSSHALDVAFVPDDHILQDFGLLVMDMDSTLINIECIDEIADMHGLRPQVARITESAMRGELELDRKSTRLNYSH